MTLLLLELLCLVVSFGTGLTYTGCYKPVKGPRPSHIVSKLPHTYIQTSSLPREFDWRVEGHLTPPTNQFLPKPCGSCWAHSSAGALTDRFVIANKRKTAIPPLSPQVLLDCGDDTNVGSCYGGSHLYTYKFIHENGITDVTCSPYMGVAQTNWGEGRECIQRMCRQCDIYGTCKFVNGTVYNISEYGSVTGEKEMMAEIYARGPIACSLYAHSKYFTEYKGGVINDPTPYNTTTHVVAIVGWGMDNDTPYWIGRNCWGSSWGEAGWFRLERGKNTLNMEKRSCSWATPQL